jgi:rhomboid family GlyGly-CTERM serine protease
VAPRLRLTAPGVAWAGLAGLLAAGALAGALLPPAAWDAWTWQPGRITEAWRWWTAGWVHWDGRHLAANLAGVLALGWLGASARLGVAAALAWCLAWPLTHLLLVGVEGLTRYAGLSGVLHAGVAVAAVHLLAAPARALRGLGAVLAVGLAAKILGEAPWRAPVVTGENWGFAVAVAAHAAGAVAGAATGLATLGLRRRLS